MARPTTTNYSLKKSLPGDPGNASGVLETFGPISDANLDAIDAAINTAQNSVGTPLDTDGTLAANSDAKVASQKAVRTYVAAALSTGTQDAVTARPTDTSAPITQKTGTVVLTKGSAGAWTLAAPTAVSDDGKVLAIFAGTAFAHTVTTPSNKINNNKAVATFAAVGDSIVLEAYNGLWLTRGAVNGVVLS